METDKTQIIDSQTREDIVNVIVAAWKNLDAEIIAPHLADDLQYNSIWVSETMTGKEKYLDYLCGKFNTIKKSGDHPIVDIAQEYGLDFPHLMQPGSGANAIIDFKVQENGKIARMMMRTKFRLKPVSAEEWYDYSQDYDEFLPKAFALSGRSLQQQITQKSFDLPDFSWIQTKLVHPSFQHLCFRLNSNVYSVLVAMQGLKDNGEGRPVVSRQAYDNLIRESANNNLIPCIFPVAARPQIPLTLSNNLFHALTGEPIELINSPEAPRVPMSDWEINNFSINIVIDYLKKKGYHIQSYCDLLGVEPQIWFVKNNELCYVVVRNNPAGKRNEEFSINKKLLLRLTNYGGYFADVVFSSANPILRDEHGEIIPLSKRFEDTQLYRGDEFYCSFKGLQKIERAITQNGFIKVDDKEIFDI